MSVLDELRRELVGLRDLHVENQWERGYRFGLEFGLETAINHLATFAAAHPGLVDRTIHCTVCGAPGPEFPPRGWTGVWVPDDGEHFRCPDCSEKEEM